MRYLSQFLKLHRVEYYDRLTAIRVDGDWEGWVRFFLQGVAETAEEAAATAQAIIGLREAHQRQIASAGLGRNEMRLVDMRFQRPLVNVALKAEVLGVTYATANKIAERCVSLGLLEKVTGRKRGRVFRYAPYIGLFERDDVSVERASRADVLHMTSQDG